MDKKKIIAIAAVALAAGIFTGYCFGVNSLADEPLTSMHQMPDGSMMSDGGSMRGMMVDMNAALGGKTGDEFDREFLSEMIVHHEGAVDMAQAALRSAKHLEIKSMANDIISAQMREISQMKAWLKSWYNQ